MSPKKAVTIINYTYQQFNYNKHSLNLKLKYKCC